ncbi:MAG: trypsin-like peptidase domain-containing protein [Lachnospiraceae bacterium]|nr:trypsin-like peptidase domain-containing protein [Lachnospiraceae bacterium]
MMDNYIYKLIVGMVMVIGVMGYKGTVQASEQFLENNKDSVVQVVLAYTAEDGMRYILQSGSGIVINSNTVLTNQHVVHLSDKNLEKAKKLVGSSADRELSRDAIEIGIVKQDDVLIYADITQESEEKDFTLLALQETTERTPAVLGSSSMAVIAENVVAIGYPTTKPFSKERAQLFASSDVNLVTGTISEVGADVIKVSGIISSGNSGGALINAGTGEVIGLLVYDKSDEKKECFKVLPIDVIKNPYLSGTTYSDNSVVPATEEIVEEQVVVEEVDKTMLNQTIESASALNREEYTSDSYLYMYMYLQQAQQIQLDETATQEEIDNVQIELLKSMQGLVEEEETNWGLIIGIIIAVVIGIIIIVVIVVAVIKMNKRGKEKDQFKVVSSTELPVYNPSEGSYNMTQQGAGQATTVLNMDGMNKNNNATTVLNVSAPQVNAYLVRKKNGDKRRIDTIEFTVGKDETKVNYYISDNETISRCHMKIVKKGFQYYIVDLESTNHTYLNGAIIPPNQEIAIKDKDNIKISDEEFTLEIL